jgi:hypothetical protein
MSKEQFSKNVIVTREQYRQIDFLRLYRLCKDLNLFNRKRKMPIEYKSNNESNNDEDSRSACRRMLRTLIIHIFPDNCKIKSSFDNYYVEFPADTREAFSYISNNSRVLEHSEDLEYKDAVVGFRFLSDQFGGFVYPRMPYSVKIHFSQDQRRRFRGSRRNTANSINDSGEYIYKPSESFYKSAKACVEYKTHWDKYHNLLINVCNRHKFEMTNGIKETKNTNPRTVAVAVPAHNPFVATAVPTTILVPVEPVVVPTVAESMRILSEAVTRSAETGPRNSQESFNRALQNMLERRGQQQ